MNRHTNMEQKRVNRQKKWPCNVLKEVVDFFHTVHPEGLNISVIAAETGMSVQGLSGLFIRDNMKLSKAEQFAKVYGYELRLIYHYHDHEIDCIETPEFDPSRFGNLYGIENYRLRMGLTMNSLAVLVGCQPRSLTNALEKSDITLSLFKRITSKLNITVQWTYIKIC